MEIIKPESLKDRIKQIFGEEFYKGIKFTLNQAAQLVSRSTSVLSWDIERNHLKSYRNDKNQHQIDGEELVEWYSIRPDFRTKLGISFRKRFNRADLDERSYILGESPDDETVVRKGLERAERDAALRDMFMMDLAELSYVLAAMVLICSNTIERTVTGIKTSITNAFRRILGRTNGSTAYAVT